MEKIVLIGGGGHCKVVIDAIRNAGEYEITGIVDAQLEKGSEVLGVKILGNDDELEKINREEVKNAFISVGSIGDCSVRKSLYDKVKNLGFNMPVICHPKAVVAADVEMGEGTFVAASATINPGARIGKNAIINTSSSVDHDCEIGDFVHIAPGVTLSGGVKIGDETHVGAKATVLEYRKIGKRCFIKASATVVENLGDGGTKNRKSDHDETSG